MKKEKTDLTWSTVKRKVSGLVPWDKNPRKLTEAEERNLRASLEKFNLMSIPVINTDDRIISGHQRIKILHLLGRGDEVIDVRIPNRPLTESEYKEAALRENQNTGSWDQELLKDMDMDLLLEVGFGDDELQALFDDVDVIDDQYDIEKALKETKVPRVKPGEIWELGDHRFLVGDSTLPDQVKKLMGNDLADIIYCDPPFNIGMDYSNGVSTSGKYEGSFTGKKDSKKDVEYGAFLDASIKTALTIAKPDCHLFYWCDERFIWLTQTLFRENDIDSKRVCLWIKNNFNMTPQVAWNKVYEPCVHGIRGKPYLNSNMKNLNEILNQEVGSGNQVHEEIFDMINIWLEKRDNAQDYAHPTQKPVSLNEKPLKRCSAPGHIVFSGFAGSGSDLIACEQLNRKWRGVEQDLIFATVIIDRWEAFTNKKAKLI